MQAANSNYVQQQVQVFPDILNSTWTTSHCHWQ